MIKIQLQIQNPSIKNTEQLLHSNLNTRDKKISVLAQVLLIFSWIV